MPSGSGSPLGPLAAPALSEAQWQKQVEQLAALHRWWAWHDATPQRNKPGFLDLFLVRPPRLILAELKTDKGRVRPEQADLIARLEAVPGVEVYVWRPRDLPTVMEILR